MRYLSIALPLALFGAGPAGAAETKPAEPKTSEAPASTKPMAGKVTLEEALSEKILGKQDAPITIMAFESLTCPHCASFHKSTLPELKKAYIDTGKARLVYVDYPLDGRAMLASMLARCTGNERFFPVLELLYASQRQWATQNDAKAFMDELARIGRFGGMSQDEFNSCMNSKALFDGIRKRQLEIQKEHDVSSTPTFVINGKKLVGAQPFGEFDKIMKPMTN